MSQKERDTYFAAVKTLMKAEGNGPSAYDKMVKYHIDAKDFAHGNGYFLSWHRAYLRQFEIELQKIDESICLPYWNWSLDSQAPEACSVFTNDYYGGNGDSQSGCVTTGAFAGWKPYYPEPHCLKRKYAYGDNLGSYQSIEGMNKLVTSASKYEDFGQTIENNGHGHVHVSIGGDMEEMHSPNDPLFWLHHGYIDYTWAIWQAKKGTDFGGRAKDGSKCTKDTVMQGLNYKAGDVLDYRQLCYEYQNLDPGKLVPPSLPPPSVTPGTKPVVVPIPNDDKTHSCSDRSSLSDLRYPQPTTKKFCEMNGLDYAKVQQCEKEFVETCYKKLNNLKGFVSPCSLLKRPDLAKPYVAPGKEVYIDVAGLGRVKYNPISNEATQVVANVAYVVKEVAPDYDKVDPKEVEAVVGAQAFTDSATTANVTQAGSPARKETAGLVLGLAGVLYNLVF